MGLAFYQIKPAEGLGAVAAAKRLKTRYVELAMPGPMYGFVWVVIKNYCHRKALRRTRGRNHRRTEIQSALRRLNDQGGEEQPFRRPSSLPTARAR